MLGHFNPKLLGVLTASEREDGERVLIDGQHRLATVMEVEAITYVNCLMFRGLTPQDEARMFVELNDECKHTNQKDRWKAMLAAENIDYIAANECLTRHGISFHQIGWTDYLARCFKYPRTEYLANAALGTIAAIYDGKRGTSIYRDLFSGQLFLHDALAEKNWKRLRYLFDDIRDAVTNPKNLMTAERATRELREIRESYRGRLRPDAAGALLYAMHNNHCRSSRRMPFGIEDCLKRSAIS